MPSSSTVQADFPVANPRIVVGEISNVLRLSLARKLLIDSSNQTAAHRFQGMRVGVGVVDN